MRDIDVRLAVRAHLAALHNGDEGTRVVEEMGVWSSTVRIDIAVINGELAGFELKSDRDTLERLPTQAEIYSRVFDQVTLVVGRRHAEKAIDLVPNWWTITQANTEEGRVALSTVRCGQRNPSPDPYLVADLLWKDEALAILERYDLAKGWKSKPAKEIHLRLASELPFAVLSDRVRETLKQRIWLRQSVGDKRQVTV